MSGSGELDAPADIRKQQDAGAHQLEGNSDSEDQFTDAQSAPISESGSPIPKTRVERVDDRPAHGEVPGTEAHALREKDAQPDEIALIPSDDDKSSSSASEDVPATVVEEASGSVGEHSQEFLDKRQADAAPDVLVGADGIEKSNNDEMSSSLHASETETETRPRRKSSRAARPPIVGRDEDGGEESNEDDGEDAFGDDFDDFEEGNEDDEDFDDFEDGFQQPDITPQQQYPPALQTTLPFPIPDLDGLAYEDILAATEPYLATLFPPEELDVPEFPPLPKDPSAFTTPRSASLWSQLVAPPPLAPPDWIRSRTRRLFLVSLGVPVDLDEILPASKQKKLVLPSLNIPSSTSPRTSSDSRSVSRLRQGEGNGSTTSVDTQGKPKRRKGPPPQPEFDMVAARHTCMITDEALDGMTNAELQAHVKKLEGFEITAKEVLEYWQKRTDEKLAEKDTFEGVIENLVKHARKVRK